MCFVEKTTLIFVNSFENAIIAKSLKNSYYPPILIDMLVVKIEVLYVY